MNKSITRKLILRTLVIICLIVAAYFIIPVSVPIILAGITAFFLRTNCNVFLNENGKCLGKLQSPSFT